MLKRSYKNLINFHVGGVMLLNEDATKNYDKSGYLHFSNVVDLNIVTDILQTYLVLIKKFFNLEGSISSFDNPEFCRQLIELKQNQNLNHRKIYDSMQNCLALNSLFSSKFIVDLVKEISQTSHLSIAYYSFIIGNPNDSQNNVGWHRDTLVGGGGIFEDGLTIWVPLHDTPHERGAIKCLSGSHKDLNPDACWREPSADPAKSDRYFVKEELLQKYMELSLPTKAGDMIIFPMNLIHSGGLNDSNLIRLSCMASFFPIRSPKYVSGKLKFTQTS
jgi:ectoine hydroxylase-related dioxygenase (phytanoyl-CoA dioxygenase family)